MSLLNWTSVTDCNSEGFVVRLICLGRLTEK